MEKRECRYCKRKLSMNRFEIANVIKGKEYRRWKCSKCKLAGQTKRKRKIKAWLMELKKSLACNRCPEDDFRVLDFHHEKDKDFAIADSIRYGYSKERILKEIAKCEILCCKCHRILHWEEQYGE